MRSIDAIGPARLDPSGFDTRTTRRRREPEGDEQQEREDRRERPKEQDSVTLHGNTAENEPELPQLHGPRPAASPAPRWDGARRF